MLRNAPTGTFPTSNQRTTLHGLVWLWNQNWFLTNTLSCLTYLCKLRFLLVSFKSLANSNLWLRISWSKRCYFKVSLAKHTFLSEKLVFIFNSHISKTFKEPNMVHIFNTSISLENFPYQLPAKSLFGLKSHYWIPWPQPILSEYYKYQDIERCLNKVTVMLMMKAFTNAHRREAALPQSASSYNTPPMTSTLTCRDHCLKGWQTI